MRAFFRTLQLKVCHIFDIIKTYTAPTAESEVCWFVSFYLSANLFKFYAPLFFAPNYGYIPILNPLHSSCTLFRWYTFRWH